jgi:hypothetical protein
MLIWPVYLTSQLPVSYTSSVLLSSAAFTKQLIGNAIVCGIRIYTV